LSSWDGAYSNTGTTLYDELGRMWRWWWWWWWPILWYCSWIFLEKKHGKPQDRQFPEQHTKQGTPNRKNLSVQLAFWCEVRNNWLFRNTWPSHRNL